jgi:autotransporter-associated beta strand protein
MNVATGAVFDAGDSGPAGTMQLDALTGGGTFQGGNSSLISVTIGAAGGGGTFSGTIKENLSSSLGIVKTGGGTEIFSGINTYSGHTIVNGGGLIINGTAGSGIVLVNSGTLGGIGTISGAVSIGAGATLAPGAPTGTLTMLNTLTLAGNTLITINSGAASKVAGLTGIGYSGTLTVTNAGAPLTPGSSFTLFSAKSSSGNFSSIIGNPGDGLAFHFNPANGVLSVVSTTMPTTPTNLTFTANSGSLTLNWPASYTGWILQAQTNPVGLGITSSNWLDVTGSGLTNSMSFGISPTNNVFFRMRLP